MSDAPKPGRRVRKVVLWLVATLIALPVVVVAVVLIAANTDPGRLLIAHAVGSLTDGMVRVRGLSGAFPQAPRLQHLEIRDARGVWLSVDDLALDWSPLALAGGTASIQTLSAAHVSMLRVPVAEAGAKPAQQSRSGIALPVRVHLASLSIGQLELAPAVDGRSAVLHVTGAADGVSLTDARAQLAIDRVDVRGSYRLQARLDGPSIVAALDASEPKAGLLSSLAKAPALGPLALHAAMEGPRTAERTDLTLDAGGLHAEAHGSVNLAAHAASLDLDATAPAMAPRPDVSWDAISLHGHLRGPFSTPDVTGHLDAHGVRGGGARIGEVSADASGNRGAVQASLTLTGLVLPPPQPNLFAEAPLVLRIKARLDDPSLPITFTLAHRLVSADGSLTAGGELSARVHTVVPDLAPLAAIGNVDIRGSLDANATLDRHGAANDVSVDGIARFTGGLAPLPTLLGLTRFGATARLEGQDFTISRAVVDGREAHADVTGTDKDGTLALMWHVALDDLSALGEGVRGKLRASGTASGAPGGLAVEADVKGEACAHGLPCAPVAAAISAQGLPATPSARLRATSRLDGAGALLDVNVSRETNGRLRAQVHQVSWRSLTANADLTLVKGASLPSGMLVARVGRLADFSSIAGQALGGSLTADLHTIEPGAVAAIDVRGENLSVGRNAVARMSLTGRVTKLLADPLAALSLSAEGIQAPGVSGQAKLTANGTPADLRLRADAALTLRAAPATLAATARLDANTRQVTLASLAAVTQGETLRLRGPARFDFAHGVSVDALHLALGPAGAAPATLDVVGRVTPTLALTAALHGVTPATLKPFTANVRASGLLEADARLAGTPAAPAGAIHIRATGLHTNEGPGQALPVASVLASIGLGGGAAHLQAHVAAGPTVDLTANGTVPLGAGALDIRTRGALDLHILNAILGASGQRAAGNLALNAAITGTADAPRIDGRLTLSKGEVQDFAQGLRLTDIDAALIAAGDTVRIDHLTAKAGTGTLSATGSLGVLAPGLPVSLHLTANRARPLTSDLLTTTLDASLDLTGQAQGDIRASGRVFIHQADINIPNGLPPNLAMLRVHRPGDRAPPPRPAQTTRVRLAITLDAPSQIFIRGHGLDAELGGTLTLGGTTASPQVGGGFDMRRGSFSLAGTTLNFTSGKVGFDGTSVTNKIDPTLDFVADSTSGGVTATLTVGGYADAPVIKLSSVPDLPQDEVLAHLLFGTSIKDLSTFQIAEIAAALAELSGATGGGADPLAIARKGLGLDRLSVGSSGTGAASLEAGRYVARGVYIGAKQALSGGGTAAEVQVDLTKHLKAKAQLATGGGSVQGATPGTDQGSTVGLSYQFEY